MKGRVTLFELTTVALAMNPPRTVLSHDCTKKPGVNRTRLREGLANLFSSILFHFSGSYTADPVPEVLVPVAIHPSNSP